jgi:hypothetical protein
MTHEWAENTPEEYSSECGDVTYTQIFPVGSMGSQLAKNAGLSDRERPDGLLHSPLDTVYIRSMPSKGMNIHVRHLLYKTIHQQVNEVLNVNNLHDVLKIAGIDLVAALGHKNYGYLRNNLRDFFFNLAVGADGYLAAILTKTRFVAPISNEAETERRNELVTILKADQSSKSGRTSERDKVILLKRFGFMTEIPQPPHILALEYGITPEQVHQTSYMVIRSLQKEMPRTALHQFFPYPLNSLARIRYGLSCRYDVVNNTTFFGYLDGVTIVDCGFDRSTVDYLSYQYQLAPNDSLLELLVTLKPSVLTAYGRDTIMPELDILIPPDFRIDMKPLTGQHHRVRGK